MGNANASNRYKYAVFDMILWCFSQIRELLADGRDGLKKHKDLIEVSFYIRLVELLFPTFTCRLCRQKSS